MRVLYSNKGKANVFRRKRYAVALLPSDEGCELVRRVQEGVALHFPVHLTLRGRFTLRESQKLQSLIEAVGRIVERSLSLEVRFVGAERVAPNLIWWECTGWGGGEG